MAMNRREFLLTAAAGVAPLFRGQEKDEIALFNGRSLAGWHKNPAKIGHGTGGSWKIEGKGEGPGVIVAEQDPPGSGNGGILLTDKKFGDFELTLEVKPDWGIDSGIFLRSTDAGQCFQAMVDYLEPCNVGHVFGEGTGGFNTRPFNIHGVVKDGRLTGFTSTEVAEYAKAPLNYSCRAEDWIKAWKIDEWNAIKIACAGKYPKITTWINGVKICEFDGETYAGPRYDKEKAFASLGREGSIALQVHGGTRAWPKGGQCRWRNIRIKPL